MLSEQTIETSCWKAKYGQTHKWRRIVDFPSGIQPPLKVRLYSRATHFLLNWWDPEQKKNLSERIDGDLLEALVRAREIDERVVNFRRSGVGRRKLGHDKLVERYLNHQRDRARARAIAVGTVDRYRTALGHYLTFATGSEAAAWPTVNRVDERFAITFAGFLEHLTVSPNGHANTERRQLKSTEFVQSVVRSMFQWATDPSGGALLGDGFRNPFRGQLRRSETVHADLFGEPDITVDMAAECLRNCDDYQLPIFAVLIFYGLRPSELSFAFREDLSDEWLGIICRPELAYFTKGRRDKRLPMLQQIGTLLQSEQLQGLVFRNRLTSRSQITPTLLRYSADQLASEFTDRCRRSETENYQKIRDQVIRDAGGLDYDRIEHEFHKMAKALSWPKQATLKDFRHLFNTSMQNAGMPEFYRRYLLGQSPGRSALVNYTHLNDLKGQYERAMQTAYKPLVDVLSDRVENKRIAPVRRADT